MNRISTTAYRHRLQVFSAAVLVALVALTGATWMTLTAPADAHAVIQLERVVIEGRRADAAAAEVQQLPRVVVTARRAASVPVLVKAAGDRQSV
ncbi:MAG: hypothetical protein V3V71_09365 [Roseateles sp.]|jgi:hypothetical protein|nr:hypothetical protein [Burkholderiaceae bacterium]RTL15235.1 MAG: hypothetical protein EKK52_21095 [Burkholderiales bacterium]|mmetsp:Transcript_655/g.1406  ORF Transcript_655/g.1406 Transcript_655/m.1406 type:complete len:94 (+) Transcript_655:1575-1856(+)